MRWIPAALVILVIGGCQNGTGPGGTTATAPPASTPAARQWTMPNLVGKTLQQAQDAIQALTGDKIFFTRSHDATGAGRQQVLDSNWKVCTQNIPAGAPITGNTTIDFGAVKLTESCG